MTDQNQNSSEETESSESNYIPTENTINDLGKEFIKELTTYNPKEARVIEKDDAWYFKDFENVTNSHLKLVHEGGPERLLALQKGLLPYKNTDAYDFGGAFHCMILEPEVFNDRYHVFDDENTCISIGGAKPRATNKYKDWYQEQLVKAGNKTMIDKEDYLKCIAMAEKVMSIEECYEMIRLCKFEKIVAREVHGVPMKIKLDGVNFGEFFLDVKTTKDPVSKFNFKYTFKKLGYHRQMALYSKVSQLKSVWMLVVEKNYPYSVGLFEIDEQTLALGWQEVYPDLMEYKKYFIDEPDLFNKPQFTMGTI